MKQTNEQTDNKQQGKRKNKSKNESKNKKPQRSIDHMLSSNDLPIYRPNCKNTTISQGHDSFASAGL